MYLICAFNLADASACARRRQLPLDHWRWVNTPGTLWAHPGAMVVRTNRWDIHSRAGRLQEELSRAEAGGVIRSVIDE
jgi:hypothetical protein